MASSPEPPAAGRLGPYRMLRRLAVGGMAEVFEARHEGSGELVVLKVLLPQHASDPEFASVLADEAQVTLGLSHPNLVRVLEVGPGYLAMERVDGPPLSLILRRQRQAGESLGAGLALLVGEGLLEALAYIHDRREPGGRSLEIVHRDITPGNVLVTRAGEVKLGDFGIARHRLRSARTRTGVIKGTVQYMAPEQVLGAGEVDQRTDLYGVGLLLFEMLTGCPFIEAEREVDLLRLAENPPWRPPSSVKPGLDPGLDRLLRPALARYPEERYASAGSFVAALRAARQSLIPDSLEALQRELGVVASAAARELEATGRSVVMDESPGPPAQLRPRLSRRSIPLIAALTLLGAAALGLFWLQPGHHDPAVGSSGSADGAGAGAGPDAAAQVTSTPALDAGLTAGDSPLADLRRRPPRTPVKAVVPPPAPRDARVIDEIGPLRQRLAVLLAALPARGVLEGDLPAAGRQQLQRLRAALARGDSPAARSLLEELEPTLARVVVDRALVEAKLKRVDGLLRARPGAAPLRQRASTALQEFMDGRYEAANRNLNEILRLLGPTSR